VGLDDRWRLAVTRKESACHRRTGETVDSTVLPSYELVRPWRRATLVAGSVAAIEFLLLIVIAAFALAHPLSNVFGARSHPAAAVSARKTAAAKIAHPLRLAVPVQLRVQPRNRLRILVLNGNGQNGAAASAAAVLRHLGYRIAGAANAARQDYGASLVMYRPGYRADGLRLARDLGVKIVGPLDGMRLGALRGGQLTVILGA